MAALEMAMRYTPTQYTHPSELLDEVKNCPSCDVVLTTENVYKGHGYMCRSCQCKQRIQYGRNNPEVGMLTRAKVRAKAGGYPCTITRADIVIPDRCPVLGIQLEKSNGVTNSESSPSLDKLVPSLGYIPGNVRVISNRANRLKNDATLDELKALVRYLEGA